MGALAESARLAHRLAHRPQFCDLDYRWFFSLLKIFDILLTTRTSTKPVCEPPIPLQILLLLASLFVFLLQFLSLTSTVRPDNSQDGCPQVRRRASEEEAVGCRCLPPPSSLLGSTLNHNKNMHKISLPMWTAVNLLSISCSPLACPKRSLFFFIFCVEFVLSILSTGKKILNNENQHIVRQCVRNGHR